MDGPVKSISEYISAVEETIKHAKSSDSVVVFRHCAGIVHFNGLAGVVLVFKAKAHTGRAPVLFNSLFGNSTKKPRCHEFIGRCGFGFRTHDVAAFFHG